MTKDRIGIIGDIHYSDKNPVARLDNYGDAIINKLLEVSALVSNKELDVVVCVGDLFHRPEVSIVELIKIVNVFDTFDCPVHIVPGNHDIFGYNVETITRTSLYLVSLCCRNVSLIFEKSIVPLNNTCITGQPYTKDVDVNGYGYSTSMTLHPVTTDLLKLHVAHGMLLPTKPVFDKYTLINDVVTTADIVVAGHYHTGWKSVEKNGTLFINNGALCRRDASESELNRKVVLTIIEVDKNKKYSVEVVPLAQALPGDVVLTREHLERKEDIAVELDEFNTVLKQNKVGKHFVNLEDLIVYRAKELNIAQDVVDAALTRLNTARQLVKK